MNAAREQHQRTLATYSGFVRSQLRRFGASSVDVDDLMQEVWLIALARSPTFAEERATRAWLSQVCRRVTAGARRTRGRTPLLPGDVPEVSVEPEQMERIEIELDEQLCMAALARLDERQLDVLTLYGGGDLSMREVAELVGEPERTVYSRYRSAINELLRDLRRGESTKPKKSDFPPLASVDSGQFLRDSEDAGDRGQLVIYRADERMCLGRLGNVVVAHWRERAYEDSSLSMVRAIDETYKRMQTPVVVLNYLDSDIRLFNAGERSYMRELIRVSSPLSAVVIDVCDAPVVRLGGTIMQALMLITRSTASFVVVPKLEQARRWIEPRALSLEGPISFEQVAEALRTLWSSP